MFLASSSPGSDSRRFLSQPPGSAAPTHTPQASLHAHGPDPLSKAAALSSAPINFSDAAEYDERRGRSTIFWHYLGIFRERFDGSMLIGAVGAGIFGGLGALAFQACGFSEPARVTLAIGGLLSLAKLGASAMESLLNPLGGKDEYPILRRVFPFRIFDLVAKETTGGTRHRDLGLGKLYGIIESAERQRDSAAAARVLEMLTATCARHSEWFSREGRSGFRDDSLPLRDRTLISQISLRAAALLPATQRAAALSLFAFELSEHIPPPITEVTRIRMLIETRAEFDPGSEDPMSIRNEILRIRLNALGLHHRGRPEATELALVMEQAVKDPAHPLPNWALAECARLLAPSDPNAWRIRKLYEDRSIAAGTPATWPKF